MLYFCFIKYADKSHPAIIGMYENINTIKHIIVVGVGRNILSPNNIFVFMICIKFIVVYNDRKRTPGYFAINFNTKLPIGEFIDKGFDLCLAPVLIAHGTITFDHGNF